MLQTHPTHSISERGTDPYGIILFLEIDCDEGPLDLTLIGSLEQFNRLYQSERKTPSFLMAIWLLQMGYTLQIARVNGCDNRTSLLLTSDKEKYSSPKYGKIYEPLKDGSTIDDSLLTYGATIEISKSQPFSYITIPINQRVYSEYILYQTRLNKEGLSSWGVIAFDAAFLVDSADYTYGIYSNLVENRYFLEEYFTDGGTWNPNSPTLRKPIIRKIIELLQQHAGIFVDDKILYLDKDGFELEEDSDKVVTYGISYYSTIGKLPMNSSFVVKENPFTNFDIKCRYLINDRIFELYSKYDSCLKNIRVIIQGIGTTIINQKTVKAYCLTIEKYDTEGNILATEQYNLNTGLTLEEANQLLNINSQLVEGRFYSDTGYLPELPIKEDGYWLDRCPDMKDATIDDFVEKLEDTDYVDSMIYLDPFMGTNETAYLKRLEELCTAQNLVFTNYKDKYDYNKLSECIFYGTFEYNGYNYPTYMLLLYLLSQTSTLEGVLDLKIEYDKPESEDKGLTVNYIFKDNYRTEVMNPLAYYNYSDISLYGVFTIIMVVNGVIWSIKNNPVCTEKDIDRWYNETLRNVENKLSSDVVVSLEERKIDNRTCTLKFGVEVTFYYSKYFTLNFNIRL